jgi:hypothetical protein
MPNSVAQKILLPAFEDVTTYTVAADHPGLKEEAPDKYRNASDDCQHYGRRECRSAAAGLSSSLHFSH